MSASNFLASFVSFLALGRLGLSGFHMSHTSDSSSVPRAFGSDLQGLLRLNKALGDLGLVDIESASFWISEGSGSGFH